MNAPGHVERLSVRVRRIEQGDGEEPVQLVVFCPSQEGRTVTVEDCMECDRCVGLTISPDGDRAFLRCHVVRERGNGLGQPEPSRAHPATTTPIAEVMTANVVCVREDLSTEALTSLLLERGISGAPVVDAAGRPVGVVTKTDLLRMARDQGETHETERPLIRAGGYEVELGPGFHVERIARTVVGEIMMPVTFTLQETAPVSRAAALMVVEGVHRIPVVSEAGKVVGILSTLDVLRWLAQQSGYALPPRNP